MHGKITPSRCILSCREMLAELLALQPGGRFRDGRIRPRQPRPCFKDLSERIARSWAKTSSSTNKFELVREGKAFVARSIPRSA